MQTRPVQISVYRDQIRTILAAVVTRIGHAQHPLLPSPPSSPSIHALFSYCCTCSLVAPALSRLTLIIVPRCLQRLLQNEHPTASVLCGQHLNHRTTSILFYAFFYTLSVEVFLFFFLVGEDLLSYVWVTTFSLTNSISYSPSMYTYPLSLALPLSLFASDATKFRSRIASTTSLCLQG